MRVSLFQIHDLVGLIDDSLPVGDKYYGFPLPAQEVEVFEQSLFGGGVESRSSLVKEQYAAWVQKGAGDGDSLALTFRESGSALSAKAAEDEIIVIDGLQVEEIKTKAFKSFLTKIGVEGKALVVTENVDEKVVKSARNIAGVNTTIATVLSPYMILTNGKMVVDKAALAKIEEVFA